MAHPLKNVFCCAVLGALAAACHNQPASATAPVDMTLAAVGSSAAAYSQAPSGAGLRLVSIEPIAYDGRSAPFGVSLIADTYFHRLLAPTGGVEAPRPWALTGEVSVEALSAAQPSAGASPEGVLVLPNAATGYAIRQQSPPLTDEVRGARVVVSVEAQANAPGVLAIEAEWTENGKPVAVSRVHPGGGRWVELAIDPTIGGTGAPGPVTVTLLRRPGDGPVQVRRLHARIVASDPNAGGGPAAGELLANADFEDGAWQASLKPWLLAGWGGNADRKLVVTPAPDDDSAGYCLELPQPGQGTSGLSAFQTVGEPALSAARPKALVFSVHGKSNVPGQFDIVVKCTIDGKAVQAGAVHPGDGSWANVAARLELPETGRIANVRVDVCRRTASPSPVLIGSTSLRFE